MASTVHGTRPVSITPGSSSLSVSPSSVASCVCAYTDIDAVNLPLASAICVDPSGYVTTALGTGPLSVNPVGSAAPAGETTIPRVEPRDTKK